MHVFGSTCYVLNTKDSLDKFDTKSNRAIFLGYSNISKAIEFTTKSPLN